MNSATAKVLIAHASKYGSTAEIAQFIGDKLRVQGIHVDIRPVSEIDSVSDYDGYIVGSPIYATRWMPSAMQFLERFRDTLAQKPTAYFTVCMALRGNEEKMRPVVTNWVKPQCDLLAPVALGLFSGALEWRRMGWIWRFILWVRKSPQGDFRNWHAIEKWTCALPEKLRLSSTAAAHAAKN